MLSELWSVVLLVVILGFLVLAAIGFTLAVL